MASGLPVLMSNDPGYRPWVEGAGPGVRLVEPRPDAILAELLPLLADGDARTAAGAAAADHARRAFSWARAADEHEALYDRLRSERR
jgi:glycosyltransferase involved in cell wall biosynthesis